MEIIITNPAKRSLRTLYDYYKNETSENLADQIKSELIESIEKLKEYPYLGQRETQLESLNLGHRYLVNGHYKVIYRVEKESIYITDFFDSRQDPSKIKI